MPTFATIGPDGRVTRGAPTMGTGGTPFAAGQTRPGGTTTNSTAGVGGATMGAFGPGNDLIGQQITPGNSATTNQAQNWTTQSGAAYNNFQFKPFQGVQPLAFGQERGMVNGANGQMQGLGYNFAGANTQYGNAQTQLGNAAGQAGGILSGVQGLGMNAYTGGGANKADTSRFYGSLDKAEGMIGTPFAYGDDVGRTRATTEALFNKAAQGTDRNALASDAYSLLEERSRPQYEQTLRQVTAKNAAMGRRGSGITTNELGDVTLAREREMELGRRSLANEASSRTLEDRMNLTNLGLGVTQGFGAEDRSAEGVRVQQAQALAAMAEAGLGAEQFNASMGEAAAGRQANGASNWANTQRGVAGDLYGMGRDGSDLAMALGDRSGAQERDRVGLGERQAGFQLGAAETLGGFTRDEYGAGVRERDTARDDEYRQNDALGQRFSDNRGYLGEERNNDYNQRQELRGERDYQYGMSRDSVDDEFRRAGFEEELRNNRFNRAQGTAQLGFGAPSPQGAYQGAANSYGQRASDMYGAVGDYAQEYFANRGTQRRSGSGTGTRPYSGGQSSGGPVYA